MISSWTTNFHYFPHQFPFLQKTHPRGETCGPAQCNLWEIEILPRRRRGVIYPCPGGKLYKWKLAGPRQLTNEPRGTLSWSNETMVLSRLASFFFLRPTNCGTGKTIWPLTEKYDLLQHSVFCNNSPPWRIRGGCLLAGLITF